jgi:hypothetical protein
MRNRFLLMFTALLVALVCSPAIQAQADDVPRYEIGAHLTTITKPDFRGSGTALGVGGRFTFNLNRSVALEAVTNFFPENCRFCGFNADNTGNLTQGLFGIKAGKRFHRWGIFGKARPGFASFSEGAGEYVATGTGGTFPFRFDQSRVTHFAMDLGGIIELYHSKHIVTRFEAGDTLIRYGRRNSNFPIIDATGAVTLVNFTFPAETRHNFQLSAGIGFRF